MEANNAFVDVNANKHFISENLASRWWLKDNHEIETIYFLSINIFVLKGLCYASAHVRRFDFWSAEPFFKLAHRGKNPLPSTLRGLRKLLCKYWILKSFLKTIFCMYFHASMVEKFEVIEEKCTN